jgi:hypothetical protein
MLAAEALNFDSVQNLYSIKDLNVTVTSGSYGVTGIIAFKLTDTQGNSYDDKMGMSLE